MAIKIKPSHKGRFTAYKKRTGKTTEQALHSKDPHVRQMANFARNAKKWKHEEGGETTSNYDLPYAMFGNIGAGIVDASVPIDETTGRGVVGKDTASEALRLAGTGASIGTMIAPGIGTAIGAGAGALLGAGAGFIKGKSEKKAYVQDAQNDQFQRQQSIYEHRPQYFANGGAAGPISSQYGVNPNTIEVEGNNNEKNGGELEVSRGKILKDFKGKPTHENGGYQYEAKPGRVIIPNKDREKYMNSDNFTRNTMERRLILNQRKRDKKVQLEYKEGGIIPFNSWQTIFHELPQSQLFHNGGQPHNEELEYGPEVTQFNKGGNTQANMVKLSKQRGKSRLLKSIPTYAKGGINEQGQENTLSKLYYEDPALVTDPYDVNIFNTSLRAHKIDSGPLTPMYVEDPALLTSNPPRLPQVKGTQPDWSSIANTAATYLPPVYNAFMASGKANKENSIYNPYTDEALNTMRNRKINMDPIRRDIFSQGRIASQPLGENQGSYLTRKTQIAANTQKALTDANIKAQDVNNNYSSDYANALNNFGQQRRNADFEARHQTLANKYNQAQFLPKAVTQAGQIGRENLNIPMYADVIKNKYAMSLLNQGYTKEQAKAETDKAYGVQNSNRYQWL